VAKPERQFMDSPEMATVGEAFALAWASYQSGDLARAEQGYRSIVEADPANADAWCLLGIVYRAGGRLDDATASYRQALCHRPDFIEAHNNLGNLLTASGKPVDAEACYRRALQLRPDYVEAHNNLGVALRNQGRIEEAAVCYREALRLRPDYADAHNNLGDALQKLARPEDAVACYEQAVRLRPGFVDAHTNLGVALAVLGRLDEAVACHRRALELRPGYAAALNNLGNALAAQGKPDEAIAAYREALRLQPGYAEAHYNLGIALVEEGKLDEGGACYREALRLRHGDAEALGNLGHALRARGEMDEAMACYQQLIDLNPENPEARMARALAWLLMGDYEHGWPEYEWRWRTKEFGPPPYRAPLWDGSPLDGRTILLHAEQGLGDTLQYVRYARPVKERGGTVLFVCPPALARLLTGCPGIDRLLTPGEPLPDFDVHAPLLSLPAILKTTLATIPADVPYIFPDAGLVDSWRRELAEFPGFKVGIAWQGNPKFKADRQRSVPLACFEPLAKMPGVYLFSLQKGPGTEQLRAAAGRFPVIDLGSRLDEGTGPFLDTAAVMKALDLVIAPDTAISHLAGALGVPGWVALSGASHFCWLLGREDSPWYPTLRLFRQERFGDWEGVVARMTATLRERLADRAGGAPVRIEVSLGELLDRMARLEVEAEGDVLPARLAELRRELVALREVRDRAAGAGAPLADLTAQLKALHMELRRNEDELRDETRRCERAGEFGRRFTDLARSAGRLNDWRAALVRRVNERHGTEPRE
jgi:tetratricopeptide (TPR) repeat protein